MIFCSRPIYCKYSTVDQIRLLKEQMTQRELENQMKLDHLQKMHALQLEGLQIGANSNATAGGYIGHINYYSELCLYSISVYCIFFELSRSSSNLLLLVAAKLETNNR